MKTKALLLVGTVALVTLSFTFVNTSKGKVTNSQAGKGTVQEAPVGGLAAEEVVR
jgi:hypothetical protein